MYKPAAVCQQLAGADGPDFALPPSWHQGTCEAWRPPVVVCEGVQVELTILFSSAAGMSKLKSIGFTGLVPPASIAG